MVALVFTAAASIAYFGWPNYWTYLLLALALGLYSQMRAGAGLWLATGFLALSAGLIAGQYQGSMLTTLPLLALGSLFLPKGALHREMFIERPPQPLSLGSIVETDGSLRLVTSLQPIVEGLEMFSERPGLVPEPLDLDEGSYLLAGDQRDRRKFLAQLPWRALLANGALIAIGQRWLLALGISLALFFFAPDVSPTLTTDSQLFIALLALAPAAALLSTFRIYRHLRRMVAVECQRLKIDRFGALDLSALQQELDSAESR